MKHLSLFVILCINSAVFASTAKFMPDEIELWKKQAQRVEIRRDEWGIPHIFGSSDADAVFGLAYAQAEDNLWAVEEVVIVGLGRASELYGDNEIVNDLIVRGTCFDDSAHSAYDNAEPPLRALLNAYSDGLNFFLYTHPETQLRLLSRFEPWYSLLGPDTPDPLAAGLSQSEVDNFLGEELQISKQYNTNPPSDNHNHDGSNAWALGTSRVKGAKALLLINPHFTLLGRGLRTEAHIISREGLDAHGSPFYGGFYIWQGFNSCIAWAHTNSFVDMADIWGETFDHPTDSLLYRYNDGYRRAKVISETLAVKTDTGLVRHVYRLLRTHHGLVVAGRENKLLSFREASDPLARVRAAWAMAKAHDISSFQSALAQMGPVPSTTTYADTDGHIAYWHAPAAPRRESKFDPSRVLPGDLPTAEWQGMHGLMEIPHVIDPSTGFTVNGNSTPYLVSGWASPDSSLYPRYLAPDIFTIRLAAALRLFDNTRTYTAKEFEQAALHPYITRMDSLLPPLFAAYDAQHAKGDPRILRLAPVIDSLRSWDRKAALSSSTLTVAYIYCENLWEALGRPLIGTSIWPDTFTTARRLDFLVAALDTLENHWGTWLVPWGKLNRMQAVAPGLPPHTFSDSRPSVPVLGVPQMTGSVFDANAQKVIGQRCRYTSRGNTFVAVVSLGLRIRARTVMGFGQSANPDSPHFKDQALIYGKGALKDVHYYFDDVLRHTVHLYHPGTK